MRRPSIPLRIAAAAGLLALALVALVVREGMARAEGQEVVLAISGFDPRALLTGHYVQFRITQEIAAGAPCPPGSAESEAPGAWVALRRAGSHHAASGAAASRASALRLGEIAVMGALSCPPAPDPVVPDSSAEANLGPRSIDLDLGVDRLHVDQTRAQAIEAALRDPRAAGGPAYAVLSVGRDGRARLKGLIVAGKRTNLDWF